MFRAAARELPPTRRAELADVPPGGQMAAISAFLDGLPPNLREAVCAVESPVERQAVLDAAQHALWPDEADHEVLDVTGILTISPEDAARNAARGHG